jgi:hypothetical protein
VRVGDLVMVKAKYNRVKIGLVVEVETYYGVAAYGYTVKPVDGTRPIFAEPQDIEIVNESR